MQFEEIALKLDREQLDKDNSKKLVILSFVLSTGIVCYHLDPFGYFRNIYEDAAFYNVIAYYINYFCNMLAGIAVSFFFMSSAFLLYYNLDKGNIKQKLFSRIFTLLIPYLLWNLIGFLFYEHSFNLGIIHILKQFLLSEYCGPLWFVRALIFMLLFIPILVKIFDNRILGAYFVVSSYFITFFITSYLSKDVGISTLATVADQFLKYLSIYLTGAYLGRNYAKEINNESYQSMACKIICFSLLVISFFTYSTPILWYLQRLQPIFLWVLVDKKMFNFKILWWQQSSFFIYAIHIYIIAILNFVGTKLGLFYLEISMISALGFRIVLTLLTLLCVFVCAFILIKIAPKVFKVLSGGRVPEK